MGTKTKRDRGRLWIGALLCLSFYVQQFDGALHLLLTEHLFAARAAEVDLHPAERHAHGGHAHRHGESGEGTPAEHGSGDDPAPHPAEDHFDELDEPIARTSSYRPLWVPAPGLSPGWHPPVLHARVRVRMDSAPWGLPPLSTAVPRAPPQRAWFV